VAPRRKIQTHGMFTASTGQGLDTLEAFWARVPAGAIDTLENPNGDVVPENCTLIRSLVTFNGLVGPVAQNGLVEWAQGILAWDGIDENVPTEVPNPSNVGGGGAAFEWVWRNVVFFEGLASGASTSFTAPLGCNLAIESRAMRKLPEGTGLLYVSAFTDLSSGGSPIIINGVDARFWLKQA